MKSALIERCRRLGPAFWLTMVTMGLPASSFAVILVSATIAPPPLPVYVQPVAPGPGFMWTPGYWAYGTEGYFWVPGTWVRAPYRGALWTPGYWGWGNGIYTWNAGYWGPRIGFYGGINYGFGYVGSGYYGGFWNGGVFNYNTAVTNVNVTTIQNTYTKPVATPAAPSGVSYNGGSGGSTAQPTAEEKQAEHDPHRGAMPMQERHEQAASMNRAQLASVNHGQPAVATTARPAAFAARHPGPHPGGMQHGQPGPHPAAHPHAAPGHRNRV